MGSVRDTGEEAVISTYRKILSGQPLELIKFEADNLLFIQVIVLEGAAECDAQHYRGLVQCLAESTQQLQVPAGQVPHGAEGAGCEPGPSHKQSFLACR